MPYTNFDATARLVVPDRSPRRARANIYSGCRTCRRQLRTVGGLLNAGPASRLPKNWDLDTMLMQVAADTTSYSDQMLAWVSILFGSNGTSAVALLKIIGINIVLSGDNAVVIALACRSLPPGQRSIGIALGAGAAIILRILFTVVVQSLLDVNFLKLAGGLLLFWIAVKLLLSEEADEDAVASGSNLWEAVRIVAIADVVMSLDNVLAIAAAAGGDHTLVIAGLLISIPLVVFGSTLIVGLLHRFPILVWAGAALLGWIAGELVAQEPVLQAAFTQLREMIPVTQAFMTRAFEVIGALLVVAIGWLIKQFSTKKAANAI
jgi:YjbE family integral membrane protein